MMNFEAINRLRLKEAFGESEFLDWSIKTIKMSSCGILME